MDELALFEDFAEEDATLWDSAEALGHSVGIFLTMLLVVVFFTEWSERGIVFWRGLAFSVVVGVALGLINETLQYLLRRGKLRSESDQRLARFFASDPLLVIPAPPDASARLLCALFIGNHRFSGGFLYVVTHGLLFQHHYPQQRPWGAPRLPPPGFVMGPPNSLILDRGIAIPPPWWRQPLHRQGTPVLLCEWEFGMIALRVPRLRLVQERLQRHIDALRANTPRQRDGPPAGDAGPTG